MRKKRGGCNGNGPPSKCGEEHYCKYGGTCKRNSGHKGPHICDKDNVEF